MSQEQILLQLAELQRANAALTKEVSALKRDRDRLVVEMQRNLPPLTEAEMAEALANGESLSSIIDRIATECGVSVHGR
ncbi:MAG: hypothetical protein KF873_09835 [Gemmataceae bacterium]|nr:hypothetical protein [Planctomycetia bacterium]MBX3399031.1 hypothetical protein [Gemmataceae bacterium]